MLFYSKRIKLAKRIDEWEKENKIANNSESVIAFLVIHNLLDETKVLSFLETEKKTCITCKYFVGCECFSGNVCNNFSEHEVNK